MKRSQRRRFGATAGLLIAGVGLVILVLHSVEAALTDHVWLLVGQVALFGGGFLGLAQLLGSRRHRHR